MTEATHIKRVAAPLRHQVAEGLRDDIHEGNFAPGQRLVESQLCERYGVSRTVVREALRQLETEGLIQVEPNRGPVVVVLTEQDVQDLYRVRGSLEGLAGELFAEAATADECDGLIREHQRLDLALKEGTLKDQVNAKDRFYDSLLAGTHNAVLQSMVASIHGRTRLFRSLSLQAPGRPQESIRELQTVTTAAAVDRDPAAARAACEAHISRAGELALKTLRQQDIEDALVP
ncbi:GntR family transcriptional regulator [Citricoccus zhacaiensis]|uniref:GntR family transcriptional regulator n=1 Tax=Citricoccus zhacaiensis TaxID=489142 RepID=A0ABQ2MC30_9MICC|nr:GntR family transcriptional regulator [Citricoccus zhacaiensis]GGO49579.1 GntR family transcriptional regulator [Citricoccus zhacaiensis]